jgi:hypothetical protein
MIDPRSHPKTCCPRRSVTLHAVTAARLIEPTLLLATSALPEGPNWSYEREAGWMQGAGDQDRRARWRFGRATIRAPKDWKVSWPNAWTAGRIWSAPRRMAKGANQPQPRVRDRRLHAWSQELRCVDFRVLRGHLALLRWPDTERVTPATRESLWRSFRGLEMAHVRS